MYWFCSFSGFTKDIILRKDVSQKQPERHQEGDSAELNFDVLSNRKNKSKNSLLEKYTWTNGNLFPLIFGQIGCMGLDPHGNQLWLTVVVVVERCKISLAQKWPSVHFTWETVSWHIYGSRLGKLITVDVDGQEAELTEKERWRMMAAVRAGQLVNLNSRGHRGSVGDI